MIPGFYRQACFGVAEMAELLEITEDTFRGWHARSCTSYVGVKTGHRLWFSAHDAYFFALMRDLVAFGVPVKIAMFNAARLADDVIDFKPIRDESLLVKQDADKTTLTLTSAYQISEVPDAHLFMPLAKIWQTVMDRAAVAFAKESA